MLVFSLQILLDPKGLHESPDCLLFRFYSVKELFVELLLGEFYFFVLLIVLIVHLLGFVLFSIRFGDVSTHFEKVGLGEETALLQVCINGIYPLRNLLHLG